LNLKKICSWLLTFVLFLIFALPGKVAAKNYASSIHVEVGELARQTPFYASTTADAKVKIPSEELVSEKRYQIRAPVGVPSIYLEGIKYFRITHQPVGSFNHVTSLEDVVTSFQTAEEQGNLGLIAHNYLAGRYFSELELGDHLYLKDAQGKTRTYHLQQVLKFRAISPGNPSSYFVDLQANEVYPAADLARRIYFGSHRVVLQTCISQGDELEWGRLFLLFYPE